MNWIEALILGLVQGLTEFLPVSSSGHLGIIQSLFGVNPESSFYFTVAVHGATVISTIVVFYKEIGRLAAGTLKFRMNDETLYVLKLIVSMIPVAIVGLTLKNTVENLFNGNIVFIGSMLIVTSGLLALAHFIRKGNRNIGFLDAFIIGLAQAFAVIPGISRSGATISTGLLAGDRKEDIAGFSFLMVLVPVIGANVIDIISSKPGSVIPGMGVMMIGFVAAFVSGYVACRWMIELVKKSKLIWFSVYCFIVGILSVILG